MTDSELSWLYRHAALVLFPTLYEGFGLVPFEAAAAGTPCVERLAAQLVRYLPSEERFWIWATSARLQAG